MTSVNSRHGDSGFDQTNNIRDMVVNMGWNVQSRFLIRGAPIWTLKNTARPFSSTTQTLSDNVKKGMLDLDIHSTALLTRHRTPK